MGKRLSHKHQNTTKLAAALMKLKWMIIHSYIFINFGIMGSEKKKLNIC